MWLDLALEGWSFYGLDQQVAYYRRHEGNATHNANAARAMRDERRMLTEFRLDYAAQLSNSHLAALDASLNRLTRSLGWTAMTSGDRATARREFFAALRLRLTWNGAMGFVAASAPKVFYDRLKQHGMNAHARTGEEA
jgi:hypothetical protein